jgi:hypothetical protein
MMGQLHDRRPIILPRHAVDHWLDPSVSDPAELKPMLQQLPGDEMQSWPVGREVGNFPQSRAGTHGADWHGAMCSVRLAERNAVRRHIASQHKQTRIPNKSRKKTRVTNDLEMPGLAA